MGVPVNDTTTPAELEIPQQAVATLHVCDADSHLHDRAETCVDAISRSVVAAELRRLSDHYGERAKRCDKHPSSSDYDGSDQYVWGEGHGYSEVADDLLARADELDPQS